MSSNIRVKKICQHCRATFIAKTTVTKFCSDTCAKRNYKKRMREEKVTAVILETNHQVIEQHYYSGGASPEVVPLHTNLHEWISIRDMAYILNVSERTLFRCIKDATFPRLKIGKKLLFNKQQVVNYFISKMNDHEG
jgi:excisionase family DNA binding protein